MRFRFGGVVCGVVLAWAGVVKAVTVPYYNDFTSNVTDFTLSSGGGGWTLDTSGSGTLSHSITSGAAATYSASVNAPALSGQSFAVGGQFVMPSLAPAINGHSSGTYVGVGAQSSSTPVNAGYSLRGFGSSDTTLQLRIFEGSTAVATSPTGGFQWRNFLGDTFRMSLEGVYNEDGSVDLIGTLTNVTDNVTKTVTYHDLTPKIGANFGFLDGFSSTNALQVNWDYLSVSTAPEPSTLAAVTCGAFLVLRRRRRAV